VNNLAISPISSSIQVFLVDDYAPVLWGLAKLIQGESPRMQLVGTASSRSAAITGVIQHRPDVILLDYEISNQSSLDFLSQLAVLGHHRILILIGQQYSRELTRQALALGACGIINKESPAELLVRAIESAYSEGNWSLQINPSFERRALSNHH
jgi:two-component system, NarL family, nitrate/nitrite response regulator NarL